MAVLVVVSSLLVAPSVWAANRQARERAARKACLAGDPVRGVDILAELFVDTKDPTYLFNQGRCFEQNRRWEDAAARFEEYLRTPGLHLSSDETAAAEKHIADCKEKIAAQHVEQPTQPTFVPVAPSPQPAPVVSGSTIVTETPKPAQGKRRWGLLTAGIVTSAVGVGGVVTGVIFNLKANNTVNEMETKLGAYSSKHNDRSTYEKYAWIGYGAGAACVVTGAILIGFGMTRSSPSSSTDVALAPAIGPGRVGAVLTGGF